MKGSKMNIDTIWDELVKCMMLAAKEYAETRPSNLKKPSGRFDGSEYYDFLLNRKIKQSDILKDIFVFISAEGSSYDFHISYEDGKNDRVSFKMINTQEVFQRLHKRNKNKLTSAGEIQLVNTRSNKKKKKPKMDTDIEIIDNNFDLLINRFDFLCVLQNQITNEQYAGIGIISSKNMIDKYNSKSGVVLTKKEDQITVKIDNNCWDKRYMSDEYFDIKYRDEEFLNKIYYEYKNEFFSRFYEKCNEIVEVKNDL